jgi:pimeloyl-ACP methyl ester carboxylesterase
MYYKQAFQTMVLILLSFALAAITTAQTEIGMPPDPQTIQLPAADELILVGSYYAVPDNQAPTVLLLHEPNASRDNWAAFVEPLWAAGYNMLLVDLRGHGETGGESDWEAAVSDVQTWLDWLREQPEVQTTGMAIIGADLGGNLAVIGCENDSECLTAIALSPVALGCADRDCRVEIASVGEAAVAYLDEMTVNTINDSSRRSLALLISELSDDTSMESIRQTASTRSDRVVFSASLGSGHGTELLDDTDSSTDDTGGVALRTVIPWLDARIPANLTPDAIEALVAAGDPDNGERLFAEGRASLPTEEGRACSGCHHMNPEQNFFGPNLLNVGERAATRVEGQSAAVYLYNAIVAPDSYVVDTYFGGSMPWRYDKGFTEAQIGDLVAYLLTLEP